MQRGNSDKQCIACLKGSFFKERIDHTDKFKINGNNLQYLELFD